MNPAVTLAMTVTGKIQFVKAGLYIVVQCIGAMIGTAVLKVNYYEVVRKYSEFVLDVGLSLSVTCYY
jgi:glycerol uptake facilitator-like aquaporin